MRPIGLSIENISTDASSNNQLASKEGIHTTHTTLGRFDVFAGRSEGFDNPGGNILLVLGEAEAELKLKSF